MLRKLRQLISIWPLASMSIVAVLFFGAIRKTAAIQLDNQTHLSKDNAWTEYTNVRFKYSICYPKQILVPQGEAVNSDGQQFIAKDGAKLIVFGRNNSMHESLEEVLGDEVSRLAGSTGKVTYELLKPTWFVVSGQNGRTIFYVTLRQVDNQFKSFELTYDERDAEIYRQVIKRLSRCFVSNEH